MPGSILSSDTFFWYSSFQLIALLPNVHILHSQKLIHANFWNLLISEINLVRNLIFASTEKPFIERSDREIKSILGNSNNYKVLWKSNISTLSVSKKKDCRLFWSSENIQKPQIKFLVHHLMNKRDNRGNKNGRVFPLFGAILIKHLAQTKLSFSQITYFKIPKQYFLIIKLS